MSLIYSSIVIFILFGPHCLRSDYIELQFLFPENETLTLNIGEEQTKEIRCDATNIDSVELYREETDENNKINWVQPQNLRYVNKTPIFEIQGTDRNQSDFTTFVCNISNVNLGQFKLKYYFVQWKDATSTSSQWTVVIYPSIAFIAVFICIAVYYCFRLSNGNKNCRFPLEEFGKEKRKEELRISEEFVNPLLTETKDWIIPSLRVTKNDVIGCGNYGTVYREYLEGEGDVAVKTIDWSRLQGKNLETFKLFLNEMRMSIKIGGEHKNVIRFKGIVVENIKDFEAQLVYEYCPLGDLRTYVRENKKNFYDRIRIPGYNQWPNLLVWAIGVATGMQYLESKNIVHRNLAARSVLLSPNKTAKLTDFGVVRVYEDEKKYCNLKDIAGSMEAAKKATPSQAKTHGNQFSWAWLAPEIFDTGEYSVNSDIWSFGVTLWELFSLGEEPYANCLVYMTSANMREFLRGRQRLPRPTFADPEIYNIMIDCWRTDGNGRPRFSELQKQLEARLHTHFTQSPPKLRFDSCGSSNAETTLQIDDDDISYYYNCSIASGGTETTQLDYNNSMDSSATEDTNMIDDTQQYYNFNCMDSSGGAQITSHLQAVHYYS